MNTIFSLKKNLEKLDRDEQRFQTTLDCYLAAILGIGDHAVEVSPELTQTYERSLQALHRELRESPGVDELTRSRATLIEALATYQGQAAVCLSKKEEDLRAMLASLAEAAENFSGHNDRNCEGLKNFAQQLQLVARGTDLSQMRRELVKRVVELKAMQEDMSQVSSALVGDLNKQLADFKERLVRTELRAATDGLTGLLNRGEGEARLAARLAVQTLESQALSVILIDLDDFKQINDRFGHVSGDQVLKTVGHILRHTVRATDTACRWGGDEFLVMLNADAPVAQQRATQLRDKLITECHLVVQGKIHVVQVKASVGASQAVAGEKIEELLTRVDIELYQQKRAGKSVAQTPICV